MGKKSDSENIFTQKWYFTEEMQLKQADLDRAVWHGS
jgi:hypothetical protein